MCDQWAYPPIEYVRKCPEEPTFEAHCATYVYGRGDGRPIHVEVVRVCARAAMVLSRMRAVPMAGVQSPARAGGTYTICTVRPLGKAR